MRKDMKKILICLLVFSMVVMTACGDGKNENAIKKVQKNQKVTLILDFIPNTNHTGIYIAKEKGYYKEEGIDLEITEPIDGVSNTLVATGKGDFGISYQEDVTYAKTARNKLPIRAIATLIQHNTSGIASAKEKGIEAPKDFEGRTYAGWGSPAEEAVLRAIMKAGGADPEKLNMIVADDLNYTALAKGIDLLWLFWAWDVVPAQNAGVELNFVPLATYDKRLDYYTPIIVANEDVLKNNPKMVRAFLRATARGYKDAIEDPGLGAEIMSKYVISYDKEILKKSQEYLAGKYIDDSENWGEMKSEVWEGYMDFMKENGLIEKIVDPKECFTNEFLPYNK